MKYNGDDVVFIRYLLENRDILFEKVERSQKIK